MNKEKFEAGYFNYLNKIKEIPVLEANEEKQLFIKLRKLEREQEKLLEEIFPKEYQEIKERQPKRGTKARIFNLQTQQLKENLIKKALKDKERGETLKEIIAEIERIKEIIFLSNSRLVVKIALDYIHRLPSSFSLMDIIQEGNIGLLRAIEKFNPYFGNKFSTYATFWVHQPIKRLLEKENFLHIPAYLKQSLRKIFEQKSKIEKERGEKISIKELSEFLGMPEKELERLFEIVQEPLSLENNIFERDKFVEGKKVKDIISDKRGGPEENLLEKDRKDIIEKLLLSSLSKKEREVIKLRFGLKDGREYTLSHIAKVYGVSRERVRQISEEALAKLRKRLREDPDLLKIVEEIFKET